MTDRIEFDDFADLRAHMCFAEDDPRAALLDWAEQHIDTDPDRAMEALTWAVEDPDRDPDEVDRLRLRVLRKGLAA